jgi:SAM-dependent methyltransferase
MAGTHRVFIPAAQIGALYQRIREAFKTETIALRLEKPLPVLQLSGLACYELAVMGSSWRCRTPFVYPLLSTRPNLAYPEWHGRPLEHIPGADWVVLGGNPEHFAAVLLGASKSCGWEAVSLVPYLKVGGQLPRRRQQADVSVRLKKVWHFVNHVAVAKIMGELIDLPEDRWHETGYVAVQDHYGKFSPYIEGRLAGTPKLVIELGCGLGQTTRSLAARFPDAKVIGLDVSRESLTVAREKFKLPNLEYREFDFANRYAFEDGSVDLIVSSSALNISDNQMRTAAETFRILSEDGLLVNGCIFEPFHTYWDFPQSAFRLSRSNLLLDDWLAAATKRGKGVELYHWTQAQSDHYFAAAKLESFKSLYKTWLSGIEHKPFTPYDYPQCTGYMVAGGKASTAPLIRVPASNHMDALEEILGAYERSSDPMKELSGMNWLTVAAGHGLYPEAGEYLSACFPGASHIIGQVLDPGVLSHLRHLAA